MTEQEMDKRIKDYQKRMQGNPDPCLERCRREPKDNLSGIIKAAACAIGTDDKMHSHQRRQGKKLLDRFTEKLQKEATRIDACKDFPELMDVIGAIDNHIVGIGELTIYDTADRIRVAKGMELDAVYMHAGTRRGASAVFGKPIRDKKIPKSDFPGPFQVLTEEEIENVLCTDFNPKKKR